MELSASTLSMISKCGHKYYLTKVKGIKEPGKKSFNMLLGDIIGDAIQEASVSLNRYKQLSEPLLAQILFSAWSNRVKAAGIPVDILEPIFNVLTLGESEDGMRLIDSLSITINMSDFEFKPPAPLKNGKPSQNKKKPPLCMKVVNSLEAVLWFFEAHHPHYALIRDAMVVEPEKWFSYTSGEAREFTVNGETYQEQDEVRMRYDLFLKMPDDQEHIIELKYTNTPYTQQAVNTLNQTLTYWRSKEGKASVSLVDITEKRVFQVNPEPHMIDLLDKQYIMASLMHRNGIYIPACGADPYTAKQMLCGFKCGGCEYGTGTVNEEDSDE